MKLSGKVAIVTGSSSGIGRGIALALAKEGAYVVVNYNKSKDKAEEVVREITNFGRKAMAIKADITKSKEVNKMVKIALDKFKKIDILVNNAGGSARERASEFRNSREETWRYVIDLNLIGTFICTRAVINHMIRQKYGKIINISSECAKTGRWGLVDYSAAKAGILGFTMALAREVAGYRINVNCVCPGDIKTTETGNAVIGIQHFKKMYKTMPKRPLRPWGRPEEIGSLVVYLSSDESSYMTGQAVNMDGGFVMGV